MALKYSLVQKARIVAGAGSISLIADVVKDAGYERPFIVFDKGIKEIGIADMVISSLDEAGISHAEYDQVVPEPPDTMVDRGAEICKENECDCVIAVGGGAVIDTAKGITALRFNPGKIMDYAEGKEMKQAHGLIVIPTTSGTGSELSDGMVISDSKTGKKVPILGDKCMSEYVVLDPELPAGMPPALTAMTGLDVFSHAMESYTTIFAGMATAPISEKVMEDVVTYLPAAVADGSDMEARERMHMASCMGGWMLANANSHVGHSMAHVIGAAFHIPHGAACAYAAPSVIRFISGSVPDKVKKIGEILGAKFSGDESSDDIGNKTAKAYEEFRDSLGLKPLSAYGVSKAEAVALAPKVASEVFAPLTPAEVTEEVAARLLEETFGGI